MTPILLLSLSLVAGAPCDDTYADSYDCDSCGHCSGCGGCLFGHGHICAWRAPGNMHLHMPYEAFPKTYYYFRPYSYTHLRAQQQEGTAFGLSPGMPYSNAIFHQVYLELQPEMEPLPMEPLESEPAPDPSVLDAPPPAALLPPSY